MNIRILITLNAILLTQAATADVRTLENLDCTSSIKDIYTEKIIEKKPEQSFKGQITFRFEKEKTSVYVGDAVDKNLQKLEVKDLEGRQSVISYSTDLPAVAVRPFTRRNRRPGLIGYSYVQERQPLVLGDQTQTRTEETVSMSAGEITIVKAYKYELKNKPLYSSRHTVRCKIDDQMSVVEAFQLSNHIGHRASL